MKVLLSLAAAGCAIWAIWLALSTPDKTSVDFLIISAGVVLVKELLYGKNSKTTSTLS